MSSVSGSSRSSSGDHALQLHRSEAHLPSGYECAPFQFGGYRAQRDPFGVQLSSGCACVLLLGVCLWELLVPSAVGIAWRYASAAVSAAFLVGLVVRMFVAPLPGPKTCLPGAWAGMATPLLKAK